MKWDKLGKAQMEVSEDQKSNKDYNLIKLFYYNKRVEKWVLNWPNIKCQKYIELVVYFFPHQLMNKAVDKYRDEQRDNCKKIGKIKLFWNFWITQSDPYHQKSAYNCIVPSNKPWLAAYRLTNQFPYLLKRK
jgi:hypothetical protein